MVLKPSMIHALNNQVERLLIEAHYGALIYTYSSTKTQCFVSLLKRDNQ